jgi:hypothetical protein
MSRTVRDAKLETRQARLKLTVRSEPYWRAITEGCHLGYYKGARWKLDRTPPQLARRLSEEAARGG